MRGGFAHGVGAALFERIVYDEDGNLLTGDVHGLPLPDRRRHPVTSHGASRDAVAVHRLGAKGLGEGTTMSAPVAIANAVADALGRDEVELPLTPARVWELL